MKALQRQQLYLQEESQPDTPEISYAKLPRTLQTVFASLAASRGEASHAHTDQEQIAKTVRHIYKCTLCKSSQPAFAMIHQKNTACERITNVGYNRMLMNGWT
ncbi:hypothetical protein MP228_011643 [Amoeboaphelidium protococcarum]|nr:hypothetical protein MP228_011643 [Amoeboaphelidium protococcarum]